MYRMYSQSRSFRLMSLAFALVLTLGAAGLVSAQSVPSRLPAGVLLQATDQPTVEPTTVDPDVPVKLEINKAATTPIDEDLMQYRIYTFSGKANQILSVNVQRITGNLSFLVRITSQTDVELASANGLFAESITLAVRLPQDGNYTLRINHDKPGSGDFAPGSISVLVSDGKAAPVPTAAK